MTIAITGHRPNKLWNDYNLVTPQMAQIREKLQQLIDLHKPTKLISGMAQGIDTLWAELAIANNLPFIAAIPCYDQESMWPPKAQKRYFKIVNHPLCTFLHISPGSYSPEKMQRRNQWMVDNSNLLIAVWDGTPGGTANCIKYAQSVLKQIELINPTI